MLTHRNCCQESQPFHYLRANGQTIQIAAEETDHIKVEDIVLCRFKGIVGDTGKPIDPTIVALRPNLTWNEVLNKQSISKKLLGNTSFIYAYII
jgi:hypothetical protein